jgi:hypothetical protein
MRTLFFFVLLWSEMLFAQTLSEGFLRLENNHVWLRKGYDVSQILPETHACDEKQVKAYLNLYVTLKWQNTTRSCFDVLSVTPAIYDPLKGGLKKYQKP